jgi:benzoyl-CoA-dihydrodiol lyase
MDDIDWADEIRVMILARLTAWQNWIFQRPNAVGPDGALQRFGTGSRPSYDLKRV